MRARGIIALVLVGLPLLPAASSAQRIPRIRIGGRGPVRPVPLPPQPPSVARELAYKRINLSTETYPLITRFVTSGFATIGTPASWTSFGMGTRADYRFARNLSATFDVTSSFLGGPAFTETAELGTRFRPDRSERRVYPFLDVRFGYMHAYDTFIRPIEGSFGFPSDQFGTGARYSQGVGGIGGAGMEFALTRRFSITTAASVMRTRMTSYRLEGVPTPDQRYRMTSYRYTFGIRYNPVRAILPPGMIPEY